MDACHVLLQVKQEMGQGGKKQLALPQAAQEGSNALVESTPDTQDSELVSHSHLPWHSHCQSVIPPLQCDKSCTIRPLHILKVVQASCSAGINWSVMGCNV